MFSVLIFAPSVAAFVVRLMKFAPNLSTSSAAASVVGSSDVSGMMLGEFPPPICVLAASLAWLPVVVVIHIVTLAATKRTRHRTQ